MRFDWYTPGLAQYLIFLRMMQKIQKFEKNGKYKYFHHFRYIFLPPGVDPTKLCYSFFAVKL